MISIIVSVLFIQDERTTSERQSDRCELPSDSVTDPGIKLPLGDTLCIMFHIISHELEQNTRFEDVLIAEE